MPVPRSGGEHLLTAGILLEKRDGLSKKGEWFAVCEIGWLGGSREVLFNADQRGEFDKLPEQGEPVRLMSEFSLDYKGQVRLDGTGVVTDDDGGKFKIRRPKGGMDSAPA